MSNILTIASNTYKEAIRDRILYIILVFAFLMIASSILLSYLSLNQEPKIVIDLGLSAINIFGLVITIFIGTNLLSKEIDKRTVFLLFSKPLNRSEFILGKYTGMCLTLFVIVFFMSIIFGVFIFFVTHNLNPDLRKEFFQPISVLQAIVLIYIELILITGFAIFFSTISSPIMSAVFTICIYLIGHFSQDLIKLGEFSHNYMIMYITKILYYVLPDLGRLNLKNQIIFGTGLSHELFSINIIYGIIYTSVLLILGIIIFERREF